MMTTPTKLGYGTWNRPDEAGYNGTLAALNAGYRHLDCAEGYENEEFVGRAIKDSGVARDEQRAQITAIHKDMRLVDGPWCPVWDV